MPQAGFQVCADVNHKTSHDQGYQIEVGLLDDVGRMVRSFRIQNVDLDLRKLFSCAGMALAAGLRQPGRMNGRLRIAGRAYVVKSVAACAVDLGQFLGVRKVLDRLQIGVAADATQARPSMYGLRQLLLIHEQATARRVFQGRVFVAHQA